MSTIKTKIGNCKKGCLNVALTGGLCSYHYWEGIRGKSAEKAKKHGKTSIIPAKSAKQLDRDLKYAKRVKVWKVENPICMANLKGCTHLSTQIHHKKGREGDLLMDTSKWLAICHKCHSWITEHSAQAIEMGLSLKRNS